MNLLIVDDEPNVCEVVRRSISPLGYHIKEAYSAEEAIKLLNPKPDLAIIDISMPEVSGLELSAKLRSQRIPFAFFSARSDDETLRHAMTSGASGYMIKGCMRPEHIRAFITSTISNLSVISTSARDERTIGIAMGILIERLLCDDESIAYEHLRKSSRDGGMRIIDVAKAVVTSALIAKRSRAAYY